MSSDFEYRLNPAYCIYKGVAIENQEGCEISFAISDKSVRRTVKKGFYDFVEQVRCLAECPPEYYAKKPAVKFKVKSKDDIEKMISMQAGGIYTDEQMLIIERICREKEGLVILATESDSESYESLLHLKMESNKRSSYLIKNWTEESQNEIYQGLMDEKLVFVEMRKSSVADVMSELLAGDLFGEDVLLKNLRGIIVQDTHEYLKKEDLLADVAVLKKRCFKKKISRMNDDEKENCFNHYTNYGGVLRNGMERLFGKKENGTLKNQFVKASAFVMVLCLTLPLFGGCKGNGGFFHSYNYYEKMVDDSSSYNCVDAEIRNSFVKTCMTRDFFSLNDWQKYFREKWNLDYIGWSRAEEFMVDYSPKSESYPLYYGYWKKNCSNNAMVDEKKECHGGNENNVLNVSYSGGKKKKVFDKSLKNAFLEENLRPKKLWRKFAGKKEEIHGEVYCRSSLNHFSQEIPPYRISGELDYSDLDVAFKYQFFNNSEKDVSGFTIVFYIFDAEGNPPSTARNNVVLDERKNVEKYSSIMDEVSLNHFFDVLPDDEFFLEYLYVSKIVFSDGTFWSDPYGMKYLN